MKPDDLEAANLNEAVYYCAPKQLLYSQETFKRKKAKSHKSSAPPLDKNAIRNHPLRHAYMYHAYSECRCSKGGRKVILEVNLAATMDALLPYGTLDDNSWLSPSLAHTVRIRDLATGQTQLLDSYSINANRDSLKRGQKLWYSAKLEEYFTEEQVRANLRTEADYKHFLANPPEVHSH